MSYNNTGSSGYIGTSGIHSVIGSTGHQGTAGPGGTRTLQMIEYIIDKFNNRFLLNNYKIDNKTFLPKLTITDNFTLKEHQFNTISMINLPIDFESFLNNIITTERDTKIDKIINDWTS